MSRLTELEATIAHLKAGKSGEKREIRTVPETVQNQPSKDALEDASKELLAQSTVKHQQKAIGKVAPQNYGVLPPATDEGLSQTALCNFYGLSWRNLRRNSAVAGFDSLEAYLQQLTGITWTQGKTSGMTKLYFAAS